MICFESGWAEIPEASLSQNSLQPKVLHWKVKAPLHRRQGSCHRKIEMFLSCSDSLHSQAVTASCHRKLSPLHLAVNAASNRLCNGLFKEEDSRVLSLVNLATVYYQPIRQQLFNFREIRPQKICQLTS